MNSSASDPWLAVPVFAGIVGSIIAAVVVAVWPVLADHVRIWWVERDMGRQRRALAALDRIHHRTDRGNVRPSMAPSRCWPRRRTDDHQ